MPRSGDTYTPVANSWNPAVGGTPVSSADWIALLADITAALSDSISFAAGQKQSYAWAGVAGGTANALTATLSPAVLAYTNGMVVRFVTGAAANTAAATLAVNGLAATAIKFNGSDLEGGALLASTTYSVLYYNAAWHLLIPPTPRLRVTANRTYYVRTDGSDSNTGLANTAGGAFLTLQKAWDTVAALDIGGFNITVQIADGTYNAPLTCTGPVVGQQTPSQITFQGNSSTPANVVITATSPASGGTIYVNNGARVTFKDFELRSVTSGHGMYLAYGSNVQIGNLRFGACVSAHLFVVASAQVTVISNYAIVGAAAYHWYIQGPGSCVFCASKTLTITGTPAFSAQFLLASDLAYAEITGNTYSGAATGTRYLVQRNGVANTLAATLPGNVAGSTATGGQYT